MDGAAARLQPPRIQGRGCSTARAHKTRQGGQGCRGVKWAARTVCRAAAAAKEGKGGRKAAQVQHRHALAKQPQAATKHAGQQSLVNSPPVKRGWPRPWHLHLCARCHASSTRKGGAWPCPAGKSTLRNEVEGKCRSPHRSSSSYTAIILTSSCSRTTGIRPPPPSPQKETIKARLSAA